MALNLSFLNNVVSSLPISPKVAVPSFVGGVVAAIIAVVHQYAPGVQLPSETTMTLLIVGIMGVVGYLSPHSGTPSKSAATPAPAPAEPPAAPPAG